MDPSDLIKHAPELLKGGAAVAGALKLTDMIKAMLGPATGEIAERFRDEVRRYRYARQLECLKKAEQMANDAGFTPRAVPIKLLFPLLEGASLEEDENLHTMWAALLANAASPKAATVRPGFVAILRELSTDEAALLNWIYDYVAPFVPNNAFWGPLFESTLLKAYSGLMAEHNLDGISERASTDTLDFGTCLDSLEAAQLIRTRDDDVSVGEIDLNYSLTYRGYQFVTACRAPKLK